MRLKFACWSLIFGAFCCLTPMSSTGVGCGADGTRVRPLCRYVYVDRYVTWMAGGRPDQRPGRSTFFLAMDTADEAAGWAIKETLAKLSVFFNALPERHRAALRSSRGTPDPEQRAAEAGGVPVGREDYSAGVLQRPRGRGQADHPAGYGRGGGRTGPEDAPCRPGGNGRRRSDPESEHATPRRLPKSELRLPRTELLGRLEPEGMPAEAAHHRQLLRLPGGLRLRQFLRADSRRATPPPGSQQLPPLAEESRQRICRSGPLLNHRGELNMNSASIGEYAVTTGVRRFLPRVDRGQPGLPAQHDVGGIRRPAEGAGAAPVQRHAQARESPGTQVAVGKARSRRKRRKPFTFHGRDHQEADAPELLPPGGGPAAGVGRGPRDREWVGGQ